MAAQELPHSRAEEVGIFVLETAGARNVGIAQPPEFGSEEGYIQFVSPTGQILVVDVAPDGWFDPMQPRYYTGETRVNDNNLNAFAAMITLGHRF